MAGEMRRAAVIAQRICFIYHARQQLLRLRTVSTQTLGKAPAGRNAVRLRDMNALLRYSGHLELLSADASTQPTRLRLRASR